MNLSQLYYFKRLAELQHYTKAAQELSITQPSLSGAIHSLEDELGVDLFHKKGRNIVLTKNGSGYLLYNKTANYNGTPVCIEFFSGSFSGWTFKSTDADIFRFNFYPLADDTAVVDGVAKFARYGEGVEPAFDLVNTTMPPKDLLFPQTQKMYHYDVDANGSYHIYEYDEFKNEVKKM